MTRGPAPRPTSQPPRAGATYFDRSALPLPSLVFLLPMMAIYELGTRSYPNQPLFALKHIQEFFVLFGATGRHLPALAVVSILLTWHIARKDSWRVSPLMLGGMLAECVGLVAPLVLVVMAFRRWLLLQVPAPDATSQVVFAFGAGIYEELLFRLVAFTLLSLLLTDLLKLPKIASIPLIVVIPALLFSLYHYLGNEPFDWQTFAIRSAAGVYFGFIFLFRGFGVTAGTHIAYDLFVILLQAQT